MEPLKTININDINNPPRITVLMAIYNCADTLEEALDSLMNQTYQRFKVVLCDDCSTDNTYEVAQKYITKHPEKFILIKNEQNMKLPYSLNRCLEYADTEYVARMDGDDLSKPERFEKEIEFLDNHPEYALVSCPMEYFDDSGVFGKGKTISRPTRKDMKKNTPHCHAPVMIRTNIIKEVGGYTVKKWTERGQDVHLWAKIYSKGHCGFNLSDHLYQMRDDGAAFKRRSFKQACYGVVRNYKIHRLMGFPYYLILDQVRPLILALLPGPIYRKLHASRMQK